MSRNRPSQNKHLHYPILILCEGESEQEYIQGYCRETVNRRRLAGTKVEVYSPTDYSPYGLLQEAIKRKRKGMFSSVWIVFDKDQHQRISQTFNDAPGHGVRIAFSSVCFETWILLHYGFTTASFDRADDLIKHLNNRHNANYAKKGYYESIRMKYPDAKSNAKRLRFCLSETCDIDQPYTCSCYTNFDELMEYLENINRK